MKSRRSIENAVAAFRRKMGVTSFPVDVRALAEKAGVKVTAADFEDKVSGALRITEDKAVMAVNENHPVRRQRFTMAHELGHFILHCHSNKDGDVLAFVDGSLSIRRDEKSKDGVVDLEMEANAFAAELLMPRSEIEKLVAISDFDLHDENIIRKWSGIFGVSEQALTVRLVSLGFLEI